LISSSLRRCAISHGRGNLLPIAMTISRHPSTASRFGKYPFNAALNLERFGGPLRAGTVAHDDSLTFRLLGREPPAVCPPHRRPGSFTRPGFLLPSLIRFD